MVDQIAFSNQIVFSLRPIYDKMKKISALLLVYDDLGDFSAETLYDAIEIIVKTNSSSSSTKSPEYNVQQLDGLKMKLKREK